jgi:hypothetical protein
VYRNAEGGGFYKFRAPRVRRNQPYFKEEMIA